RIGLDVGHVLPPFLDLRRDSEAATVGHERDGLRAERRVSGAGARPDVEAVAMERADHFVALHHAVGERAARVRAAVLEPVELAAAAEDGDLGTVDRECRADTFLKLVRDDDWPGGALRLWRRRRFGE